MSRQLVLDTETTGTETSQGHRIIEIGAVELIDRKLTGNNYHQYIHPEMVVEAEVIEIHGITNEFLEDKPVFAKVVNEFMEYVKGAELIIHNAPFDVGFINHELSMLDDNPWGKIEDHCTITDTLKMARKLYPGQRNTLDALCTRYEVDNSGRTLHGALLDSEILSDVYLRMTGGQTHLFGDPFADVEAPEIERLDSNRPRLPVVKPHPHELDAHAEHLKLIEKKSGGTPYWSELGWSN